MVQLFARRGPTAGHEPRPPGRPPPAYTPRGHLRGAAGGVPGELRVLARQGGAGENGLGQPFRSHIQHLGDVVVCALIRVGHRASAMATAHGAYLPPVVRADGRFTNGVQSRSQPKGERKTAA